MAVLPFARPGIISPPPCSASAALGETLAVAMVFHRPMIESPSFLTAQNPNIAANIALQFPEASARHQHPHRSDSCCS
jgi:ABC-type phosphate transport system permease subunit